MAQELTKKQQQILDYMKEQLSLRGYPPSVREIGAAVGLKSTSSVHSQLEKLEAKGFIKRDPAKPRAIEIMNHNPFQLDKGDVYDDTVYRPEIVHVPVIGTVTAGMPILATENIDSLYPLPIDLVPQNHDCFMLKVKGDSMIEAGILNGDYIVVAKTETASNGQIVVALVNDDEATVKRFYKENGYFRLQPENASMEPIIVDDVKIIGRVEGLMRKF